MKFTTFVLTSLLIVAAPAVGMPASASSVAPSTIAIPRIKNPLGYQGDGLYVLTLDQNGEGTINFTSMADLHLPPVVVDNSTVVTREQKLGKRDTITCATGLISRNEIAGAANCLAAYGDANPAWSYHDWVWCFSGNAVAYGCAYQTDQVSGNLLQTFQTSVDRYCGLTGLGYDRCTNDCGINDLAVGRDIKGRDFCASGFNGL